LVADTRCIKDLAKLSKREKEKEERAQSTSG
jgi:hypothetical protein